MRRYESYKDSGVAWLGEVPSHWEVENSKRVFSYRKDKAEKTDEQLTSSQKYGVIPQNLFMDLEGRRVTVVEFNYEILKHVEKGDFVISMRSFQGGIEYCNYTGCVSSAYVALIPTSKVHSQYYRFLLKSGRYIEALQSTSNLVRDGQALRYENFCMVPLIVPPLSEQQKIAQFLDDKTAKIDQAVDLAEKQITLLKEHKQILIQNAVTRGLNPDVPLKDSGVEWIGQVPEHWEILSIKRLSQVKRGASPRPIDNPKYFDNDGEYAWVRISDVTASNMYLLETTQKLSNLGKSYSVPLMPGSLFLSIAGSVGKPIITKIKVCIHDGFVYFPEYKQNTKFLYYIFYSEQPYIGLGKMGTQLNLNTDTVGAIKIPIPPLCEQQKIADYLDTQTAKIDQAIALKTAHIEKLKEYKSVLINDVVTGKVQV